MADPNLLQASDYQRMLRGYNIASAIVAKVSDKKPVPVGVGKGAKNCLYIPSASRKRVMYKVDICYWACRCPDYSDWGNECKHMWAAGFVLKTFLPKDLNEWIAKAIKLEQEAIADILAAADRRLDFSGESAPNAATHWYVTADLAEESATESTKKLCEVVQGMATFRADHLKSNIFAKCPTLLTKIWNPNDELEDFFRPGLDLESRRR